MHHKIICLMLSLHQLSTIYPLPQVSSKLLCADFRVPKSCVKFNDEISFYLYICGDLVSIIFILHLVFHSVEMNIYTKDRVNFVLTSI